MVVLKTRTTRGSTLTRCTLPARSLLVVGIGLLSIIGLFLSPSAPQVATLLLYEQEDSTAKASNHRPDAPLKVAHVVSLISCKKASRVQGFLDALVILRHSIHQNSVHNGKSKYSYQMVAIIHESGGCDAHVDLLEKLGYIPLVKSNPVNVSEITTNDWYRDNVKFENCCGDDEFVKLYAYTLIQYPIVVHWDLDVAVLQPMDDLFDAMLLDKDSESGKAARERLHVQYPRAQHQLPDRIDAFFTRDVTSAKPWEKVRAVQGGFVVARPSLEHFAMYQSFILEANYTPGRGPTSGWGGLGYGGFQGAMAYQGVIAYFYDQVHPNHAVELDVCRWNQVVADVIWRGPERMDLNGTCRQFPDDGNFEQNTPENGKCRDCRILPLSETKTVHYTACKKPWECTIPYPRVPGARRKQDSYRLQELTNVTTCGLAFRQYFAFRRDIEERIAQAAGLQLSKPNGEFWPEYFHGYCKKSGAYIPMDDLPGDITMKDVYGS